MYPETILPIAIHVPHAGIEIPDVVQQQFIPDHQALWSEIRRLTDWYTDELFSLPGIAKSVSPVNRIVVDLERYVEDNLEEKSRFGQGVIYTHNTLGDRIRYDLSHDERQFLLDNYYRPWHTKLETILQQQLQRWGYCLLLDCHSFPNTSFSHENDAGRPRPDICLGTCLNTPTWMLEACCSLFLDRGYTVEVDFPYAGCLVPDRFVGNHRVLAIMLEINRRLYLEPTSKTVSRSKNKPLKSVDFHETKIDIWAAILSLAQQASIRLE